MYQFDDDIQVIDGGVLGINLLGVISKPDHLIVVDAIRNRGNPGDLYRLEGDCIPERIRAKNSLHQIDFLEALTLCQALDKVPQTVILGVEPEDIETLSTELTPATVITSYSIHYTKLYDNWFNDSPGCVSFHIFGNYPLL